MNKLIILTCIVFVSCNSFAVELSAGRIIEIKGEGFISRGGKTKEIRKGDQIYANSEIAVEHTGYVTFTDNADHRFHLGNSSSVAIGTNTVELRTGDLWFQSLNKTENYQVKTANALVDYQGGEAIISYDVGKGKTQLMVINGMMKLSNLRTTELNLSVAEGNFSFIDMNYEEGAPRDPTPVGEKTYHQLISMFHGISPLDKKSEVIFKHEEVKREIASVHTEAVEVTVPVAVVLQEKAKKVHTAVAKIKKVSKVGKQEMLSVHIFGMKSAPEKMSLRMPASVKEAPAAVIHPAVPPVEVNKVKETEILLQSLKNL
jgi:hypothetical protein